MKSLTKSIRSKLVSQDVHAQFSLPIGNVLRDVRSAFFGLCINAGKAVLGAMMEAERTALCGPKGVPAAQRIAYRGGHTRSSVVLGGRRIAIIRPRARAVQAAELVLPSFAWATHADPLNGATMAAMAPGFPPGAIRRHSIRCRRRGGIGGIPERGVAALRRLSAERLRSGSPAASRWRCRW